MRDVLLITVDSLRADTVGFMADRAPATPALDHLAAHPATTVAARAFSVGSYTKMAFPGILTGTSPRAYAGEESLAGRPHVAELFADAGYRTGAFHSAGYLSLGTGYERGFDHFDDGIHDPAAVVGRHGAGDAGDGSADGGDTTAPDAAETADGPVARLKRLARRLPDDSVPARTLRRGYGEARWLSMWAGSEPYTSAADLTDRALDWLGRADGPRFAWCHYMDPHVPYLPREGTVSEGLSRRRAVRLMRRSEGNDPDAMSAADMRDFRRLYHGETEYLDRHLGRLFDGFDALDDPLAVLFSDHGDAFGEHGLLRHGGPPLGSLVHVPCLVHDRGNEEPRDRIETAVSAVDLVPTLLDGAGVAGDDRLVGRSVRDLPTDGDRSVFAYRGNPEATPYHVTAIDGDRQVVRRLFAPDGSRDGTETTYRLGTSTAEAVDEAAPELSAAIDDHLADLAATTERTTATDDAERHEPAAAVQERLARLGYRDRDL
ncbi:sulfatase [Haloglomus halophilum]|uniref:sulfatase n=1 Tax=Haloglomus halophilum TaxID=2962672 RepID=UPI0020CA0912|nr:sulfatase [Haloglomus halophilum]